MPKIQVNGAEIYFEEHGASPEAIVFAHELLLSGRVFANDRIGIVSRPGIADQLDQITIPTLIVVGDQDATAGPAEAERMHARIRGSKLVGVPGAGHASTVEEPGAVNAALGEFLSAQAD